MLMNCSLAERALVGNRGRSIFLAQNQQQLRLKVLAGSSRLGRHAGVRKKERKKEKGRERERKEEAIARSNHAVQETNTQSHAKGTAAMDPRQQ
jgi:hypothetical protein